MTFLLSYVALIPSPSPSLIWPNFHLTFTHTLNHMGVALHILLWLQCHPQFKPGLKMIFLIILITIKIVKNDGNHFFFYFQHEKLINISHLLLSLTPYLWLICSLLYLLNIHYYIYLVVNI